MGGLVPPGCEISREGTARRVARHHHLAPYAALVLRGGYVEAGDRGRFRARSGHVLLHDPFEAHQDQFDVGGADIINLPLFRGPLFPLGRLADADEVVRLAERDPRAAAELLLERLEPCGEGLADWPDLLARDLRGDAVQCLGDWARERGLLPSSLSRGFRLCYGISPQRYRLEQRAAHAARAARLSRLALSQVAAEAGFADQAHMARTTMRLFGRSPSALRRGDDNCVQYGTVAAN